MAKKLRFNSGIGYGYSKEIGKFEVKTSGYNYSPENDRFEVNVMVIKKFTKLSEAVAYYESLNEEKAIWDVTIIPELLECHTF
jgi:hypothetical protein